MKLEAPEPQGTFQEIATAVARAVVSAIPFAGGAGVEIVQAVAMRGREKRLYEWFAEINRAVNGLLDAQAREWDDLATDDGFINAIGAATAAAAETADEIKLEALRNAVLNSTFAPDTALDRNTILMRLVADLTGTHIAVLRLYDDPPAWYRAAERTPPEFYAGSASQVVKDAIPRLAADNTLLLRVVGDLKNGGLTDVPLNTVMTNAGIYAPRTLPLGAELLAFITAPPGVTPARR